MLNISEEWALVMFFVGFILSGLGVLCVISLVYIKAKLEILIRKLKRKEEEIKDLEAKLKKEKRNSGIDSLTGLYNRRYLDEKMDQLISWSERYKMPLSYLFIDLDNFKRINDNLGHKEGDNVLKLVAEVIRKESRHTDVYVRLGGDEFFMALPGSSYSGAEEFSERLELVFVEAFMNAGIDFRLGLGASIGVFVHREEFSFEEDMEETDRAMYLIKERRKK